MQNPVMARPHSVIPVERIASRIYLIRGEKVMLDSDLADLYGVETRTLVQAVKRNHERFPPDFMFQLSDEELENLRSQIVMSSWGGRRYAPYAFTELGVAMLSSVLRSKRAVQVNIEIIRVFVTLREMLATNRELARKVAQLDHKVTILYENFQKFIAPPNPPKKYPVGYVPPGED
jgi:hypothetical protein